MDEALWVATGAPLHSMNVDATFLSLIDSDKNGRIICYEVRDAITWLLENLRDHRGIKTDNITLKLDSINTDAADGKIILACSKRLLSQLALPEAESITLTQVREIKEKIKKNSVSDGGIVLPEASNDDRIKKFIADIVDTVGGTPHPGGRDGVNENKLDEFLKQAREYCDWHGRGALSDHNRKSEIMPLGADTRKAYASYTALRDKMDQYFAQCKAVSFNPRTINRFQPGEDELKSADMSDPQAIREFMKKTPLAEINGERTLSFDDGANPWYAEQLEQLKTNTAEPALGKKLNCLSMKDWEQTKRFFSAHEEWTNAKAGATVEKLGPEKLNEYLGTTFADAVRKLITESHTTALALDHICLTEQLILFQANIFTLVNNFVSFPHLYDPDSRAVFEMGTLIVDGRHLNFSMKVKDRTEHSKLAKTSNIFVVYAEVFPDNGEKVEIAAPVTYGIKGNLVVGKRGIFRDINGKLSDARIVQIIENPISIGEAMVSPFRRIGKLLTGRIETMTTAAEKKLDTTTTAAVAQGPIPGTTQMASPSRGLLVGGLVMGGGVALAALGTAVVAIVKTLKGVAGYKIVIGVTLAILAVIMPVSLIAMLKLRRRDLSAILEGAGWAINARMRLTLRQGRLFTQQPKLPEGAGIVRSRRRLLILVVVAWILYLLWRLASS